MKEKLLTAALGTTLIISQACEKVSQKVEPTPTVTPVIRTIDAHPEVIKTPNVFGKFDYVYPEFKGANLAASDVFNLDLQATGLQIPTEVINFTDYKLNENVLNEIYRQVQHYADIPEGVHVGARLVPGKDLDLIAQGRTDVTSRSTIFIPENAPLPRSDEETINTFKPLASTFRYMDGFQFSYVQTKVKNVEDMSIEDLATNSLAVEACQQIMEAHFEDSLGNIHTEGDLLNVGQEVFCNSLGIAVASKMVGLNFDQYMDRLKRVQIESVTLFALTPDVYGNFSTLGTVISK